MASPFLQGFQVGAGVASDNANRALRMQELQSQRQMRMLQERNLAEQLQLRMEERNLAIQERADMAKAITAAQEATQPFHILQGPDGEMGVPNPNPMTQEQAAMRFVLPVVGKYQPSKVPDFLEGVALAEYRKRTNQFEPSGKMVQLPSGKQVEGIQTSPNNFTPVVEPEIIEEIDPTTGKPRAIMRSGLNRATPLPQDIGARNREAFNRNQQAKQLEFVQKNAPKVYADLFASAPINPDTGLPQVTPEAIAIAAKTAGFEGSTVAATEQQMIGAENLLQTSKEFLPLITKNNVGWRGAIQRWGSRLGMEGAPGFKNASDAEKAATMSRVFMSEIFRTLRSDSNIAKPEVEALEDAAPNASKFINDPDSMKSQMASLLKVAAQKSRNGAVRLGRPITPFFLTKQEIVERAKAGEFNDPAKGTPAQQAAALYNQTAWSLIDALEER